MEVRLVVPANSEADADQATRDEAEALARWLKEEVINLQEIRVNGVPVKIKPRQVAVLLRTLTQLRVYLEAFRRYDLAYLTEGEKHFFERQEVRDCLCILRVLAAPHDRIALVGVLRSPVGGCSDVRIAQLFHEQRWKFWEDDSPGLPAIYPLLRELRQLVRMVPVGEIMDLVFQKLPILELAAATLDGEQAVANILKLRDMVQELTVDPDITFRCLVEQLMQWANDKKPEAEASLSEAMEEKEGTDGAIRVLNIHKAKGLEFPMVIVAGLHQGTGTDAQRDRVWVNHDWLTDLVGFRMGHVRSLSGIFMESKLVQRIQAERVRLFYVALTRAQRRLVLSAGLPASGSWRRGSLLALLEEGLGIDLDEQVVNQQDQPDGQVAVGGSAIQLSVIQGKEPQEGQVGWKSVAWQVVEDTDPPHQAMWVDQQQQLADHRPSPLFMSPTTIIHAAERRPPKAIKHKQTTGVSTDSVESQTSGSNGRFVGIVAHRVLQGWDFQKDPHALPAWIEMCCDKVYATNKLEMAPDLLDDLQAIFAKFVRSEPYTRLCEADILGREVPFAISWPVGVSHNHAARSGVMQGVMDVVYRWHDALWVADYKTDQVTGASMEPRAEQYREQVGIYRVALSRSLGTRSVKGQLIFLRVGQAIEWS